MEDLATWRARIGLYCARIHSCRGGRSRARGRKTTSEHCSRGTCRSSVRTSLVLGLLYIAVVLSFQLILSGDVELNPGPGDGAQEMPGENLSLKNLRDVTSRLWDIRTEWFNIGLKLGLQHSDLKSIETRSRADPDSCLPAMLELWLKSTHQATWGEVVTALHATGMVRVASGIEKQYNPKPLVGAQKGTGHHGPRKVITHLISSERELLHLPIDNWFEVGQKLQVSEGELRRIRNDQSLDTERKKMEMLTRWFQSDPEASYESLASALAVTNNESVAEELCLNQLGIPAECIEQLLCQLVPDCVEKYSAYLKEMYASEPIMQEDPWPPPPSEKYIDLALMDTRKDGTKQDSLKSVFSQDKGESLKSVLSWESNDKKPLKVLIDGCPGSGKSTLCRKIVYDWSQNKFLEAFSLVVLVPLRDPEIASAESIDDFFYHDDTDLQTKVVKYVRKNQGKNVLLIFDGFDELSHIQRTKSSIFLQVLQGKKLSKCSVVVTSRPYASQKIESLQTICKHIQVTGFKPHEAIQCIKSSVKGRAGEELVRSLNGELRQFCENPLNCAILIFVYKQEGFKLPGTQTEIIDCFLSNALTREADIQGLECKAMLECDLEKLSQLAYHNHIHERIVFRDEDIIKLIGPGFKSLGLLTALKGFTSWGRKLNYHFTHLLVQDFLTAKWVHQNYTAEQVRDFLNANLVDDRYSYVLRFLAGLSKLNHNCSQQVVCSQQLNLCTFKETTDHKVFVMLIQLIYEAQNSTLCPLLSAVIKDKILKIMISGLTLEISAPLAFFIDHSCITWEVVQLTFKHSTFVQFMNAFKSTNELTTVKNLFLYHQPVLDGKYNCCSVSLVDRLLGCSAFGMLNSLSVCSRFDEDVLQGIFISYDKVSFSATHLRRLILKGQLKHLTLHGVFGASGDLLGHDIIQGDMGCLKSLDLKSSGHTMLGTIMELSASQSSATRELYLRVMLPTKEHMKRWDTPLAIAMMKNDSLQSLVVRSCHERITFLSYSLDSLKDEHLPEANDFLFGISQNTTLKRLTLGDMNLHPQGVLDILQNNNTLHTLNLLFVPVTKELIISLCTGLKHNHSLKTLCLIDTYERILNEMTLFHPKEIHKKIPYHTLLDAICISSLQVVILDFDPYDFTFFKKQFFRELKRMLLRNTTLTQFTLNHPHFTKEDFTEVARVLVLNGRRNEIDLTFGETIDPTIDNLRPKKYVEEEGSENLLEHVIQEKVDEFKELMFQSMLKTLGVILATRKRRQAVCIDQIQFATFIYIVSRILQNQTTRQRTFLAMI